MSDRTVSSATLKLQQVRWRDCAWQAFSTEDDAAWHVIVHVLSEPESRAWKLLLPQLESSVDLGDADDRLGWLDRALRDGWGALQEVYDAYVGSAQQALADAERCGWHGEACSSRSFFGLDGILVGVRHCLRTIFVVGMGSPRATVARQGLRREGLHQCQSMPDKQSLRRLVGSTVLPERRWPDRWEPENSECDEHWIVEERFYYRVFRKAFRALQQRVARAFDGEREPAFARSLQELRRRLPTASPCLEEWRSWRRGRTESRSVSHDASI